MVVTVWLQYSRLQYAYIQTISHKETSIITSPNVEPVNTPKQAPRKISAEESTILTRGTAFFISLYIHLLIEYEHEL